jgi:spermidine synthase
MKMHEELIYEGESEFSRYRIVDTVYEGRQARVLFGGGNSPQSGMATDDRPELLFDYNQRFLEVIESRHPKRILLIGGGVFMLPQAVLERYEDISIDVVEIDPLLPELARKYFGVEEDERLNVIVGDGRAYVESCQVVYDMIIVDAFAEFSIPRPLLTEQAVNQYARCLSNDGMIGVNFISAYYTRKVTLSHELMATFKTVFPWVELYPADHEYPRRPEQNLVLLASSLSEPSLDYLQSEPAALLYQPKPSILRDDA